MEPASPALAVTAVAAYVVTAVSVGLAVWAADRAYRAVVAWRARRARRVAADWEALGRAYAHGLTIGLTGRNPHP